MLCIFVFNKISRLHILNATFELGCNVLFSLQILDICLADFILSFDSFSFAWSFENGAANFGIANVMHSDCIGNALCTLYFVLCVWNWWKKVNN